MEIDFEAPPELKKKIAKKLHKSGFLRKIEKKIKLGMMVAIEEINEDEAAPSNLTRKPLENAGLYEQKAFQSILSYLAKNNMTYTLATLLEESNVKRNQALSVDILKAIKGDYSDDEDGDGKKDSESDDMYNDF